MENDHAAPAVFFFLLFFSHCPSHRAASSSLLLPPRSITMEADEDADSDSLGALSCPPQCPSPPSPWGRRGAAPRSPPQISHVTASPHVHHHRVHVLVQRLLLRLRLQLDLTLTLTHGRPRLLLQRRRGGLLAPQIHPP
uniref:Uncharacterized protein n=1 Tax=Setaria italica TaxID=4555 RepID=K4APA5_SETIT